MPRRVPKGTSLKKCEVVCQGASKHRFKVMAYSENGNLFFAFPPKITGFDHQTGWKICPLCKEKLYEV